MRNNYFNLKTFNYGKLGLFITKNKLTLLVKEGYLETKKINNINYIKYDKLTEIIELENELSNNYMSTNSFLQTVCRTSSSNLYKNQLTNILQKCNQLCRIRAINYRNKIYFNKHDVHLFIENSFHKHEVLNYLNINVYIYESIKSKNNLDVIKLSKNTEYVSNSTLCRIKRLSKRFSLKEIKAKWSKGTTIINKRLFNDLFKNNESLYKFCKRHSVKHFRDEDNILYVDYHSLSSVYRKNIYLSNNYYTFTELKKMLGMPKTPISILSVRFIPNLLKVCKEFNIKYIKTDHQISGDNIFFNKKHIDIFLNKFISNREIVDIYNITYSQLYFLINYNSIKKIEFHNKLTFYNRNTILNLLNKNETHLYLGDTGKYYTLKQALDILNLSNYQLNTIRQEHENQLSFYNFHNTTYYKKEDINSLLEQKKEVRSKYIPSSLASKNLGEHYLSYFKTRKNPRGIERYSFDDSQTTLLLLKTEYEYLLKKKELHEQIDSVSYHDPILAFYDLININKIKFSEFSKTTQDSWFEFCEDSILYNNKAKNTLPYFVNQLVKCTRYLSNFVLNSELHFKSSNEINLGLLNVNIAINQRNIFMSFFNIFYYKLVQKNIPCSFKLKRLQNISKVKNPTSQDMDMYDYNTFKKVYSYANNDNNKCTAIKDALYKVSNHSSKHFNNYAYSWLYILLHLNNAWRHRDFCHLEMIDISFLNIQTLKEFKNKNLTIEEVDKIINLLLVKEYTVSKTNVTNNFFISDDIKDAVANAYVVCHLINEQCFPTQNKIINFNNKNNNFLESYNNYFFKDFPVPNFKFKNRKMNRTLLSIMYSLFKNENHNGPALNIAKRLRSHKSEESTNIYIKIPEDDMNELSFNLFNRGIFGYIPKMLNEIVFGASNDIITETKNIKKIKKIFKSIYNIEASSGFLNNIINQKESVIELFRNKGSEEAFETLNKLQKNFLPAKDDNFQCIVSDKGCLNNGLDCKNCIYSVPNFYATANIVESISKSLEEFNDEFTQTVYETEKTKMMNLLFMELDILDDAIQKFGEDVVLDFFKDSKQGYIKLLELLNDVNSKKPIHEYATYTPKGVE